MTYIVLLQLNVLVQCVYTIKYTYFKIRDRLETVQFSPCLLQKNLFRFLVLKWFVMLCLLSIRPTNHVCTRKYTIATTDACLFAHNSYSTIHSMAHLYKHGKHLRKQPVFRTIATDKSEQTHTLTSKHVCSHVF